jgi:hypothetical protein
MAVKNFILLLSISCLSFDAVAVDSCQDFNNRVKQLFVTLGSLALEKNKTSELYNEKVEDVRNQYNKLKLDKNNYLSICPAYYLSKFKEIWPRLEAQAKAFDTVSTNMISSSHVWNPDSQIEFTPFLQCRQDINCILDFMRRSGASDSALQFTDQVGTKHFGLPGYLDSFVESGHVDLGEVMFPSRANTNNAYIMLNGSPWLISTELGCNVGGGAWHQPCQNLPLDITRDPLYPLLKRKYPNLELWPAGASFVTSTFNPDGGQRFIFAYMLVDGCHACYAESSAHMAFDFSSDGAFVGFKLLKLVSGENTENSDIANGLDSSFQAIVGEECKYLAESKANSKLIQAALGIDAQPCVTFPYLAKYGNPEPIMPWYHAGIDLKANSQTAYAVVNGTVVVDCGRGDKKEDTACTDSMGIVMIETELNGSKARVSYVHMSESFVNKGKWVSEGDPIGRTGNRFNSNPNGAGVPHLHIEVRPRYTGTSAVGFISCSPDKRCDTKAKVEAITLDPILLLARSTSLAHDELPPIPYEDAGACPFECCTYRSWIATKDSAVQQDRNDSSPTFFYVKKGEWVTALTGVVNTTVPGKAKLIKPTTINGISAKIGEFVYLMTYHGEGEYETWYKGKKWEPYADVDALEIIEKPVSTWWAQIKNNQGQVGWTKDTDSFDNKDECGGVILEQPVQPTTYLTASAMGKTARENGVLELSVPMRVAVEVNLSVSQSDLSKLTVFGGPAMPSLPLGGNTLQYIWYKDDKFMGEGNSLKQKFSGSPEGSSYEIKVTSVDRRFATSASTPAVPSQAGTSLTIKVKERKDQACLGRLGRGCDNPLGVAEDAIVSEAFVQQNCGGDDSKICIRSKISVGAIKHDKCCIDKPGGQMCNGLGLKSLQPNPIKDSECEDEWEQAENDKLHENTSAPTYYDVPTWVQWMWEQEPWVYRPNDPDSGDNKEWWHIAPSGAVVNQKKPEDDKEYCKSNNITSVEVTPGGEYLRTGLPPQLSQTKKVKLWVCGETDEVRKTVIQAPKETVKSECIQKFSYSTAITGVGAQSVLSKYSFNQADCQ